MSLADSANETAPHGNNCQLSFLLFEYDLLENLNTQWNPENKLHSFHVWGLLGKVLFYIFKCSLEICTISLNVYGLE